MAPRPAGTLRPPDPVAGDPVAASKMPKSRSSRTGTNLRRPVPSRGPARLTYGARRAHRSTAGLGVWARGVVGSDHPPGRSALGTPSASTALGWAPRAGARPPMCPDPSGNQNRPSRAPRAHSPCKIATYPGRGPFWPARGARRNLGLRFRLIRAVSARRATQSCTDPRSGAEPCAALPEGRARSSARGAPVGSGPRRRGAVPADPCVLWC